MMGSKCVWVKLLLFMFVFGLNENSWTEGCREEERLALLQLKNFFNDPNSLTNWMEGDENSDCCLWAAVECSNTTGRVKELHLVFARNFELGEWYLNASLFSHFLELELLDLSYNNIAGFVENEGLGRLSSLTDLKFLYLDGNMFNNSIFSSLDALSSLTNLSLSGNRLEGTIDIKGLTELESLRLGGNIFGHTIFSSLSGLLSLKALHLLDIGLEGTFDVQELDFLSNLEELSLSFNAIDKFVVPEDYKGLRKLKSIYLEGVGNISDGSHLLHSMGSFPSLKKLDLKYNNFTKKLLISTDLQNFTNLEELTLDRSSFHISLLQSLATFSSLKSFSMRDCEIHGISEFQGFLKFKNLEFLDKSGTALNNSFLQISRSLKVLYLSNCGLKGTLYNQGLCELVHLQELRIDSNDLRGSLPWCLANMTSLQELDVSSNQLSGNISSSPLKHLTSIQYLCLSNNHFQIPVSLGSFYNHSNLTIFDGDNNDQVFAETDDESQYSMAPKFQLNSLSLFGHGYGGTFPKFLYHQHELEFIDLSHNNLTGDFPNWLLENNTKLGYLVLANNSLSGPFHMPSNPLKQLNIIDISNNLIEGHIPVQIGEFLPSLRELNISRNAVYGSIPSSFGNMNSLKILDLSNNQLTDGVPEHLAKGCFSLKNLVLSSNSLQGHIFSKGCDLRNLVTLHLNDNYFVGEIPECLSNSRRLKGLYLSDNHLFGRIPRWLGDLSSLNDIIISNNHLEGPIPTEFCQLDSLEILDISENKVSGSLPSCLGPPSFRQVHLSKNMLQGQLKDGTFCNSSSLVTLDLSYNLLSGHIPNWIDKLSQLRYLILANNNLEGEVPVELCRLNQLRLMDLSHNNLFGQIPTCLDNTALHKGYYDAATPTSDSEHFLVDNGGSFKVGRRMGKKEKIMFTTKEISYSYQGRPLSDMFGIDLSCNKLIGDIPPEVGSLTRIRSLNLSHNNLTGSIPVTFSNLNQIESLDLSYNQLNGKIPPQLVKLNALAVFRVSHNRLSGKIPEPTAQFATFNESSYEENPLLCGLPLPKSCNEIESPPSTSRASIGNREDYNLIDMDSFRTTFTVSYVIVFLGIIIVLYVDPYWRGRWFYLVETWMTSSYYFVVDHLPRRFCD